METERIGRAREAIEALASDFAETAEPILERALHGAVERLVEKHAAWFNEMDDRTAKALRSTVGDVIRKSALEVAGRLRDPDLWLSPSVMVDEGPAEALDGPTNRVWVLLLNAARQLDRVLGEFGLEAGEIADPGGGHYGLQPTSAHRLDPSGQLGSRWQHFRRLYEEYRRAMREPVEEREQRDRDEARKRWTGR